MLIPFNPQRLVKLDFHGENQYLVVKQMEPLKDALARGQVQPSTPVLLTTRNDTQVVFQTRHFSLYNVMQGQVGGQPWMATFCAICNGGTSFSPVIDGKVYTFYGAGFYDAMTLLADHQTGSYWDHITGECVAGELKGARLELLANLLHTQAGQVAESHPQALLAITSLDPAQAPLEALAESIRTEQEPTWLPGLVDAEMVEDTRLPRLEMGLGVWTKSTARFYRFKQLHALDNILFDEIEGERFMIYVDPDTLTPTAIFTDATSARFRGDTLLLDNGQSIRQGVLIQSGEPQPMKLPLQLFQRWYGFSITFPGCEIYTTARAAQITQPDLTSSR